MTKLCKLIPAKYNAEFLGTMFLVLMGCGAAVISGEEVGLLGIAFAFGLAMTGMAYAIGPVSGCHINPAVTLSKWLMKRIGGKDALIYAVMQILGGIAGAALLWSIIYGMGYEAAVSGLGQNAYDPIQVACWSVFLAEAVFTALFVLVILMVTRVPEKFAGIVIGSTLALVHIVGIPIDGTSVNPARSIGPAVMTAIAGNTEALAQVGMFVLAPLAGALLAVLLYRCNLGQER